VVQFQTSLSTILLPLLSLSLHCRLPSYIYFSPYLLHPGCKDLNTYLMLSVICHTLNMCVCVYVCVYIYIYICVCVCMYVCIYMCVYMCVCVCVCVGVYNINYVVVVTFFAILSYNHNFYAISNFVLPASYAISNEDISLGVKWSYFKPDHRPRI
jgi:hypothetical protein